MSNRKMAELLDLKPSNVDTLRRGITQPSVPVLLRLEALSGIEGRKIYAIPLEYNDFPIQPILSPMIAAEPANPYQSENISDLPIKDFFKHVENLTKDLNKLRLEFEKFSGKKPK